MKKKGIEQRPKEKGYLIWKERTGLMAGLGTPTRGTVKQRSPSGRAHIKKDQNKDLLGGPRRRDNSGARVPR